MDEVIYYYATGHLSRVTGELRRALGQYARHNKYVKVGITNDPERRWQEHQRERAQEGDSWSKMVVIYETSSWTYVTEAERRLVQHAWDAGYDAEVWNDKAGGAGRIPESDSTYYVYVLID